VRHGDFAICAVAAVADARRLRIAVGGVADRPGGAHLPLLAGDALDDALNDFAWSLDVPATTRRPAPRCAASWCASSAAALPTAGPHPPRRPA
jgi:hypothetical protein